MKTISVRLNTEEERVFTAYADIMGEPLSALFKRLIEVFFIKSSQLPSPCKCVTLPNLSSWAKTVYRRSRRIWPIFNPAYATTNVAEETCFHLLQVNQSFYSGEQSSSANQPSQCSASLELFARDLQRNQRFRLGLRPARKLKIIFIQRSSNHKQKQKTSTTLDKTKSIL